MAFLERENGFLGYFREKEVEKIRAGLQKVE